MRMGAWMKGAIIFASCASAASLVADSVAIDVTGPICVSAASCTPNQPFNYTQGSYLAGFAFRATSAISITQLGFYDSNLAGTTQTFKASMVGVYDLTTNTLLTSAVVSPSDSPTGFFRYVSITPLAINTTDVYAVVGITGTNYYTVGVPASTSPVNAAIHYLSPAYYYSSDGSPGNDTQTSTLVEPDDFSAGNIFGTPNPPTDLADFGANFQFTEAESSLLPAINALGVVNNASFAAGSSPLPPGAIAAVFGSNLNNGSKVLFSSFGPDGKLVTTLGGAQVAINGIAVPIFYSTPAQLGIQIPTDLTGSSVSIQVTVGSQTSIPQNISISPFSPGLFSTDQSGHGQGAILIANTDTLAAPPGSVPGRDARPAKPGEFITIFCTGLGDVTPSLATGEPGTNNTTLDRPTVTIDGNDAIVEFSGVAPGFVGLDQVNVQVPAGTRTANDIPVLLTIGGLQSNTVTIAVSGS
jgi:uncharacterized protein (TIGR03437 family)